MLSQLLSFGTGEDLVYPLLLIQEMLNQDSFGRDQTCSMLLGIVSGNSFLMDGSTVGTISTMSPDIVAVAKQAFYDFGERPMWAERITYGTSKRLTMCSSYVTDYREADSQGTAIYSGRREGFSIYFSRLVRPLWRLSLTKSG
jgi:nuclear pore complex protein Nup155